MTSQRIQQNENVTAQDHFPCEQCGAELRYSPAQQKLICQYCGFENSVHESNAVVKEHTFNIDGLYNENDQAKDTINIIRCPSCGAKFELTKNEHAGDCSFCGTPVVTDVEIVRKIYPESLLPFIVTETKAKEAFALWLKKRWFAPSSLTSRAKRDERLIGIYIPHWTYDCDTNTRYSGERGTIYYETETYTTVENGKSVMRTRQVPRTRWTSVSGQVFVDFDDVLVNATQTLPRKFLDRLAPWDLDELKPYNKAYLSGFRSELYQINRKQGFEEAKGIMANRIRSTIRQDIGGDKQRIHYTNTHYSNTTFKHLLLPIWAAAFQYNKKSYRFVINGRTGKTQGERPYSIIKITFAVIFVLIVIVGISYGLNESGAFK